MGHRSIGSVSVQMLAALDGLHGVPYRWLCPELGAALSELNELNDLGLATVEKVRCRRSFK